MSVLYDAEEGRMLLLVDRKPVGEASLWGVLVSNGHILLLYCLFPLFLYPFHPFSLSPVPLLHAEGLGYHSNRLVGGILALHHPPVPRRGEVGLLLEPLNIN
ncbi:hypothetical protein AMECASPLE_012339 [Ameca splendens]|uniref:Uncharacterized protein n=1 Tax=Ameca splendens TaxID=208324 RepID=A0ABV0XQB0_9TELE